MPRIPTPEDPRNKAIREHLQKKAAKTDPRQFRDALTRANGAEPGLVTEIKQWNRWDR